MHPDEQHFLQIPSAQVNGADSLAEQEGAAAAVAATAGQPAHNRGPGMHRLLEPLSQIPTCTRQWAVAGYDLLEPVEQRTLVFQGEGMLGYVCLKMKLEWDWVDLERRCLEYHPSYASLAADTRIDLAVRRNEKEMPPLVANYSYLPELDLEYSLVPGSSDPVRLHNRSAGRWLGRLVCNPDEGL
jgi:hypothetical protein